MIEQANIAIERMSERERRLREMKYARRNKMRYIDKLLNELEMLNLADQREMPRGLSVAADNLLLMTSTGARSGEKITTPLVYRRDGHDLVVVASKGGAPENPKWYGNVKANPVVEIEVAGESGIERLKARARPVSGGEERDR